MLVEVACMSDLDERQTGIEGSPMEPFVVSFGAVGQLDEGRPDLAPKFIDALTLMEAFKSELTETWPYVVGWVLQRSSLMGVDRSWHWANGIIDERKLAQALETFPQQTASIWLSNMNWGGLQLSQDEVMSSSRRNSSLTAHAKAPQEYVDQMASSMLGLLEETAAVKGVESGFVHVDSIVDPYSQVVANLAGLSAEDFSAEVHGYYWAVLLTERHIHKLGGAVAIHREAPCAVIKDLDSASGRSVLCVLTESPLEIDAKRMIAWRHYLRPLLRVGYPGWQHDVGVRRAPLHRPVWLFEGTPVPGATKHLLSFGLQPTQAPPQIDYRTIKDPDSPICLLVPGERFDPAVHFDIVKAIVNAWCVTAQSSRLYDVKGTLGSCSGIEWDTADDGQRVIVWQVDTGDCDIVSAITLLTAALSQLEDLQPDDKTGRVLTSLRLE
jgi:hypothetical protein